MGCDIHLRLERKAKGQSKWQDCHIFGYDRCWSDRIYGMFAALADVRNYNNIEYLPPRGIPKDATRSTLLAYGYEVVKDTEKHYDFQCGESQAKDWVENAVIANISNLTELNTSATLTGILRVGVRPPRWRNV